MAPIDSAVSAFYALPIGLASLIALGWNVVLFVVVLVVGDAAVRLLAGRRCARVPPPLTRREVAFSVSCVVLNTAVTVGGMFLWHAGIIVVAAPSAAKVALDVGVLFFAMDLGMYLGHRVAHHPALYRIVHATHHSYEDPRPLSLFVLNPAEVIGFGGLWLAVLCVYHATALGMVVYLGLNATFGLMGHLGVEPAPRAWGRIPIVRAISTSTFHAEHHRDVSHNYGFYTVVWDRLFSTLSPDYEAELEAAARGALYVERDVRSSPARAPRR